MFDDGEAKRAFDLRLHSVALPCMQGEPLHLDPSCPPIGTTRYRLPAAQEPCKVAPWGTIDDAYPSRSSFRLTWGQDGHGGAGHPGFPWVDRSNSQPPRVGQ